MISREVVDDIDVSIQGRSPGFLGFVFRWLAFVAESVAVRGSGERSGVRARFFVSGQFLDRDKILSQSSAKSVRSRGCSHPASTKGKV